MIIREEAYAGLIPRAQMESALQNASSRLGMALVSRSDSGDSVSMELEQTAPWFHLLIRSSAHRTRWTLTQEDRETTISCRPRMFPWFLCLLVGSSALWALGLHLGAGPVLKAESSALEVAVFFFSLALLASSAWLLLWCYSQGQSAIWEQLFVEADLAGAYLRPKSRGTLIASRLPQLAFLGYTLLVVFTAMGSGIWRELDLRPFPLLPALLALVLLLLALFVALFLGGVLGRATPVLPALLALLGLVFVVGLPLAWLVLANGMTEEKRERVRALTCAAYSEAPQALEDLPDREQAAAALETLRPSAAFTVGLVGAAALIGMLFLRFSLHIAVTIRGSLKRFHSHARDASVRLVTSGVGFLSVFRIGFATPFVLLSLLLWAGMLGSALCAGYVIFGSEPATYPFGAGRSVEFSEVVLAVLLRCSPDSPGPKLVAGAGWVCLVCVAWFPVTSSMLQLWSSRRAISGELNSRSGTPGHAADLDRALERVTERMGAPRARLVVVPGERMKAFVAGRPGSGAMFLVLTEKTVERLSPYPPILEAAFAHELAHVQSGHHTLLARARVVGRLLLMGDTAVSALVNTYRIEMEADRRAIESGGTSRIALAACLRVLEVQGLCSEAGLPDIVPGLSHEPGPPDSEQFPPRRRASFRDSLRDYYRQYTTWGGYWHPHLAERLRILNSGVADS